MSYYSDLEDQFDAEDMCVNRIREAIIQEPECHKKLIQAYDSLFTLSNEVPLTQKQRYQMKDILSTLKPYLQERHYSWRD